MIKSFFPFALLLTLLPLWLTAQTPRNIVVDGPLGRPEAEKMMCNEAGTITFGAFIGQSNDVDPDTIFLCLGDSLRILHNGDFDLSGDPDPATPAGIGYAFYDCPPDPAFFGPDLATILGDPCLNGTSPIVIGGTPVPQQFGIWVAGAEPSGNLWLTNDGTLQSAFNNGTPGPPIQFFFAPITVDDLSLLAYEEAGGPPAGPCVDVNTEEAFSVVYLNAIQAPVMDNNAGANGCSGSFTIRGGLPEFIASESYDISIELDGDPAVTGNITVNNSPGHNESVEFFVPQPGIYNITVEDGKSCGFTFQMDMGGCQAVTLSAPLTNAVTGDNICLPITVADFNDVTALSFSIEWDPTVLTYTGSVNFNTSLPGFNASNQNVTEVGQGRLGIIWADLNFMEFDLPDDAVLVEVCFDVIGLLGDETPIAFVDDPVLIEAGDGVPSPYGVVTNNGQVDITNAAIFVSIEQDSVTCPNGADGAFTVTVSGGTPPYFVTWNTSPPMGPDNGPEVIGADGDNVTVSDLMAGVYTVNIADSEMPPNTITEQIEVFEDPELAVNVVVVNTPTCNGDSTGSVRAEVLVGGVLVPDPETEFDFTWSIPGVNTSELTGVPGGNYAVTVTNANGCEATDAGNLNQPPPIQILLTEPVTDATCDGSNDGAIRISVGGGVSASGNYNIDWGTTTVNASVSELDNLNPGEYCVTVTDDNNCTAEECFTVNADKLLDINPVVTDLACNGDGSGAIVANGTTFGALPSTPYTFVWEGPVGTPVNTNTSSTVSDLAAGAYIVTMTDSDPAGCLVIDTIIVSEPEPLTATLLQRVNETCTVGMDGIATPEVTGGTLPYSFVWTDTSGAEISMDSIATGLSQGDYQLEVTDANDCTTTLDVEILAPTPPNIVQLQNTSVACAEDTDGTLTVVTQPTGAPIASIVWSNGQTGETATNLSPGVYYVTVTADDACAAVDSAFVNAPAPLSLDTLVLRSPECPGEDNGQITVFAEGGTTPYRFIWSTNPGDTTTLNPIAGLAAGEYSVTVVDDNNCEPLELEISLPDPPAITVDFTMIDSTSCFGESICDGSATAEAGYSDLTTGTFNFLWLDSGETDFDVASSTATSLCRGEQRLVVSDGVCGDTVTINIPSPPPFQVNPMKTDVSCNGAADGEIELMISGATPPYTIDWPALGQTGATVTGLSPGTYTAQITDDNGCVFSQTAPPILEPDPLTLTIDEDNSTASVTCSEDSDGLISVVANGGTAPYSFTWSDNVAPSTSDMAENLLPGAYGITVTDLNACQDSTSYTIQAPPPIDAVVPTPPDPLCSGESTLVSIDTITGGNAQDYSDYSYTVDGNGPFPPDFLAPVFAGPHTVVVFDTLGCSLEIPIDVTEPDPITVSFNPSVVVVELGDTTTILEPIIQPATAVDSFVWSPAAFLSSPNVQRPVVIPQRDQEYTLTAFDANGCSGEGTVFVELDRNRNIYIPNVFSPNGDGVNETFNVFACLGVEALTEVRIFDRWGELLFEATDLLPVCEGGTPLWDGEWNGDTAPTGVYVYTITVQFLDGVVLTYRGDVTLLR